MEPKANHMSLCSKIYKELFTISWRIKGFNKMPFLEDHPVCGPWFILGKKRESTWSLMMTKQIHEGVPNVGFKLVRAEEGTMWDTVTLSLGLKTDDGWFVSCIDKQVVGKESSNPYVFLTRPAKCGVERHVCRNCEVPVKECVTVGKVLNLIELSGVRVSGSIENESRLEGSSGVKGTTVENGSGFGVSSAEKGTIVENGCCLGASSGVITTVENGCSLGVSGVNVATTVENGSCLVVSPGVKGSTVDKGSSSEEPLVERSANYKSAISHPGQSEKLCRAIISHKSEVPVVMNGSTNVKKSDRSENSDCLHISTELPNSTAKDKNDTQHLTPEELFQQENVTVVCKIEYTYMMYDPIANEEKLDHSGLIEALHDLYASGKYSDITLKCEGVHFMCHKAILCARSPLFQKFMDEELVLNRNLDKEGSAQDQVLNLHLDLTTAKSMLLYVYTDGFDHEMIETVAEYRRLWWAAVQFGLRGLKKLCLAFLREIGDGEECVFEEESGSKLDQKLCLISICSEDDDALVGEQAPVTNIGTQTSVSN